MYLIEILLPLFDDKKKPITGALYERLAEELTDKFGGVTSLTRAPAEGRWRDGGATAHDDIVVLEVMAPTLDRAWWSQLRLRLMREFRQEDVVIRSSRIERLR
jgi:hypothetical protein